MKELYYVNHNGIKVNLDAYPYITLTDTDLFNSQYQLDTVNNKRISMIYKSILSKSIQIRVQGNNVDSFYENLQKLNQIIEVDTLTSSPGRLYFGDCYINCVLTSRAYDSKFLCRTSTVVSYTISTSDEGYWHRDIYYQLITDSTKVDDGGLNYDYNYDYNYTLGNINFDNILNDYVSDCDFIITTKGYAFNPEILIGDNVLRVYYTIQKEDNLVINSKQKTIELIRSNKVINLFRYRDTSYDIFQKIKPGESLVWWNGTFNIDILLIQDRGEPQWI